MVRAGSVSARGKHYTGGPNSGNIHKTPHHSQLLHSHHQSRANAGANLSATTAEQSLKGGFDGPMVAPWRKTVSIFKQPVTLVHTTSRDTRQAPVNELQAASRAGAGRTDKPKQVFWAKRLEGLRAMQPMSVEELDEEEKGTMSESLALPSRIQAVGPDVGEDVAAASLASALQTPPQTGGVGHQPPITGQTNPKKHLDSNPGVFTNPDQPLIHAVVVSDQDITAQERRVLDARRRLEEVIKHFG